jgi:hypothetical protein
MQAVVRGSRTSVFPASRLYHSRVVISGRRRARRRRTGALGHARVAEPPLLGGIPEQTFGDSREGSWEACWWPNSGCSSELARRELGMSRHVPGFE